MATEGCMLNPVADCAPNVVSGGAVSVSTLAIPEGACGALVVAVPAVLPFEVADIECMASSSSESDDQLPADDEADSVAPKMEVFRFASTGTFNPDVQPSARNMLLLVGPKKFKRDLNDEPRAATCGQGVQRAEASFRQSVPRTKSGSPGLMQYSSNRIFSEPLRP